MDRWVKKGIYFGKGINQWLINVKNDLLFVLVKLQC